MQVVVAVFTNLHPFLYRILLRIRQLHIIRWSMLAPYVDKAMKGVPAKYVLCVDEM